MTIEEWRELYRKGAVGVKPLFYMELGDKVKQLIKCGVPKSKAIVKVSVMVGVSQITVWRACQLHDRF